MQTVTLRRLAAASALLLVAAATAGAQEDVAGWSWNGTLAAGRTIHLRNVNGEVRFEPGTGNTVEIRAEKRWRRGDPDDVSIEARRVGASDGDILVCALWGDNARCAVDGYRGTTSDRGGWRRDNDVSVHFTVKVPANARVDATTVNGDVYITGTSGHIEARTVNGDVEARSSGGRVQAETVNGSIIVRTTMDATDDLEYETVNGSITIELPANANADVDLRTVNGRISSDFPMTLQGSINPRRIQASIGNGGRALRIRTVNGSIRLEKY